MTKLIALVHRADYLAAHKEKGANDAACEPNAMRQDNAEAQHLQCAYQQDHKTDDRHAQRITRCAVFPKSKARK